jgi:hypothetical protein
MRIDKGLAKIRGYHMIRLGGSPSVENMTPKQFTAEVQRHKQGRGRVPLADLRTELDARQLAAGIDGDYSDAAVKRSLNILEGQIAARTANAAPRKGVVRLLQALVRR